MRNFVFVFVFGLGAGLFLRPPTELVLDNASFRGFDIGVLVETHEPIVIEGLRFDGDDEVNVPGSAAVHVERGPVWFQRRITLRDMVCTPATPPAATGRGDGHRRENQRTEM